MRSLTKNIFLVSILSTGLVHAGITDWGNDPLWDDGFAEVATYEARRSVYGKLRTYETVLITVKEDFSTQYYTKADPPFLGKALFPVLKLNITSEIQTENYPYSYLTSIFVDRNDVFRLVKMTNGSQEWCGNTFKLIKTWGEMPELVFHSYWDGEGDGSQPLQWGPNSVVEDQLPLSLRALPFSKDYTWEFQLLPTQITNKVSRTSPVHAVGRVVGQETVRFGQGTVICWRVDLEFSEMKQSYWFEKAHPNTLIKFRSSDERSLKLIARNQEKYWEKP